MPESGVGKQNEINIFYSLKGKNAMPRHVPNPMTYPVPPAKYKGFTTTSSALGVSSLIIQVLLL